MLTIRELAGHERYSKNFQGMIPGDSAEPCVIWGRPIKEMPTTRYVHVHNGGDSIVTEEEAATMSPNDDLGLLPIGSDCPRRNPQVKPYAH